MEGKGAGGTKGMENWSLVAALDDRKMQAASALSRCLYHCEHHTPSLLTLHSSRLVQKRNTHYTGIFKLVHTRLLHYRIRNTAYSPFRIVVVGNSLILIPIPDDLPGTMNSPCFQKFIPCIRSLIFGRNYKSFSTCGLQKIFWFMFLGWFVRVRC